MRATYMNVVHINTFYYLGGSTGKIAYLLMKSAKERKWNAYIVYGKNKGEIIDSYSILIAGNYYKKINELKARILGNHGFNNIISSNKAIEYLKNIKPDVIHLHNLHGSYINLEMLFAYIRKEKIPVVWTLHDCWSFTGRCACYDFNNCSEWKCGCTNCKYKKEYPVSWISNDTATNFVRKRNIYDLMSNITIVTPSKWLYNELSYSILKNHKKVIINNGIDLTVYKPTGSRIKENNKIEKMMLAVAYNWTEQKGFKHIIEISKVIKKPWTLVVIGVSDFQNELIKNEGVIGINKLSDERELVKWYSSADVFINPTLEDNFPTVNIEALACGTPCITFDTGGAGEIVTELTGKVIEKNDWKGLLKEALNTNKKSMSGYCRQRAMEMYDKEKMIDKYFDIYEKAIKCAKKK